MKTRTAHQQNLKLLFFGFPRFECDDRPIEIENRKAIALLAYLAVSMEKYSRDTLATLLWPESNQQNARTALRGAIWAINKALGKGWLDINRESVALIQSDRLLLDVARFEDRLTECQMHSHSSDEICPDCVRPLTQAVALYRDDFLAGFTLRNSPSFDEWQTYQSEYLRGKLIPALEKLIRCHVALNEFERAVQFAHRILLLDPLSELTHRQLMQLYAWSNQQALALQQYHKCENILKQELSISPTPETSQLYIAIKENRLQAPPDAPLFQLDGQKYEQLPTPSPPHPIARLTTFYLS